MQTSIVGIYDTIANCPPALEQLGRAFMAAKHRTCDLSQITKTAYQQVGDIVLQAMRGREFPTIALEDQTPLTSHRVTKLTFSFIAEVLLHSSPLPEELQIPIIKQTVKAAMASTYTKEERQIQLVTQLTNANVIAPFNALSVDAMARKQLDLFRSQVEEYHPRSYPGNLFGCEMAHYFLLAELDCTQEHSKDFNALCNKIVQLTRNIHSQESRTQLPLLLTQFGQARMVIAQKIQQYIQKQQPAK